ncbi:MAG: YaiI/YqxD family protein [Thiolinea sp.]
MQIWVDADACPKVIKEILFRAAERQQIEVILVANQPLSVPRSLFIKTKQVCAGFDVADDYIAQHVAVGDLVITADIPLAAQVIDRQAYALNPRGEFYTPENMRERLRMRNLMEELRSTGAITGGHPSLNQQDRQAFANQLDRFLARYAKTKITKNAAENN